MTIDSWDAFTAQAAVALAACPPDALAEGCDALVRSLDPAGGADLLLVDYRLEQLRPVLPGAAAVPVSGTDEGRCYEGQRVLPLVAAGPDPWPTVLLVPVTVRGDRLGVLRLRLPTLATVPEPTQAAGLGVLVGQALLAAGLVTDRYRVARRDRSMTVAAEMQWESLPGHSLDLGAARVAAHVEPAYAVVGDAYDWVAAGTTLGATVLDAAGYGSQAAASTGLTLAALRNARREGADLVGAARLADQALYARHRGEVYASCVLLDLDAASGEVQVVLAGAGEVVLVDRGRVHGLALDRQPPLGTEEDYPYKPQFLQLTPGQRLLAMSDGLTGARIPPEQDDEDGGAFGDLVADVVAGTRLLRPDDVVRALIGELRRYHRGRPQADDAVVLCLEQR